MDILIEELAGSLWAAAVDKTALRGLEIDPVLERVRYGSIYWARVKRIDTALDAAFLDIDGENTGILYNRDVRIKKGRVVKKGGDTAIGKTLSTGQFIMVQARMGYLPRHEDEDVPTLDKTPVMTMDISVPGRYLIGTPLESASRISSRIRDKKLRKQLDTMIANLPDVNGVILRKSAAHTQTDWIVREAKILSTVWDNIERSAIGDDPHLIMMGADAVQRTLADQAASRIDAIELPSLPRFQEVQQWAEIFAPDLVPKLRVVEGDEGGNDNIHDFGSFMERNNLMEQIDDLLDPYCILPGGGNIIIQGTAALTAIDVNSARDRRGALAVNLEAATEIARHIRLRNLGGIIVIDLLKMPSVTGRRKVIDHLQVQFDDDPCTVQIHGLTKLGLLELTRNRRTPTLAERVAAMGEEG
jgi:ribonuclease G